VKRTFQTRWPIGLAVVAGLPGRGRDALADTLLEQARATGVPCGLVSPDAIAEDRFGGASDFGATFEAFELAFAELEAGLRERRSMLFSALLVDADRRAQLRAIAGRFGVPTLLVALVDTDPAVRAAPTLRAAASRWHQAAPPLAEEEWGAVIRAREGDGGALRLVPDPSSKPGPAVLDAHLRPLAAELNPTVRRPWLQLVVDRLPEPGELRYDRLLGLGRRSVYVAEVMSSDGLLLRHFKTIRDTPEGQRRLVLRTGGEARFDGDTLATLKDAADARGAALCRVQLRERGKHGRWAVGMWGMSLADRRTRPVAPGRRGLRHHSAACRGEEYAWKALTDPMAPSNGRSRGVPDRYPRGLVASAGLTPPSRRVSQRCSRGATPRARKGWSSWRAARGRWVWTNSSLSPAPSRRSRSGSASTRPRTGLR
jgi:hypothetical protein